MGSHYLLFNEIRHIHIEDFNSPRGGKKPLLFAGLKNKWRFNLELNWRELEKEIWKQ